MIVSVEVPDPIAYNLRLDGEDGKRRALEMLALQGYRSGELSRGQVGEVLGLGFQGTEQFLHDNHAAVDITLEEINESAAALKRSLEQ